MAGVVSRRKLAQYAADQLLSGGKADELMRDIAAYLIDTRQTRSADLVVMAIEEELQVRGVVIADVVSAHPLSAALRKQIEQLIGASQLHLREVVDQRVIGGVKITLPDSQFDGTIQHKLTALKGVK